MTARDLPTIARELREMLRVDHSGGPEWPMLYIEPPGRPGIHKLATLLAELDQRLAAQSLDIKYIGPPEYAPPKRLAAGAEAPVTSLREIVEHYDDVTNAILPDVLQRDGLDADFVMTVADYRILRDKALAPGGRDEPVGYADEHALTDLSRGLDYAQVSAVERGRYTAPLYTKPPSAPQAVLNRHAVIRECWEAINAMIQPGDLPGSGTDKTAQRNGLVLAANQLMVMMGKAAAPPAPAAEWKPIESAPKGKLLQLWIPEFEGHMAMAWPGRWSYPDNDWVIHIPAAINAKRVVVSEIPTPTHWRLPEAAPPSEQPKEAE